MATQAQDVKKLPVATRLPEYETKKATRAEPEREPFAEYGEDAVPGPLRDRRGSVVVVGSVIPYADYRAATGRPTTRTDEITDEIFARLAEGEPLKRICRDEHMPAYRTIWGWCQRDEAFANILARSRESATHAIADDCIDIADRGDMDARDRGVRIDTRLKLIEKWNRKDYGQKQDVQHSGSISLEAWVIEATPAPAPARVIEGESKRIDDIANPDQQPLGPSADS